MEADSINLTPFDPAEYLTDAESRAEYLTAAFETNDQVFIRRALGVVARAYGMSELADRTEFSRTSLYKATGDDGNPALATVAKLLDAMGLHLAVVPNDSRDAEPA